MQTAVGVKDHEVASADPCCVGWRSGPTGLARRCALQRGADGAVHRQLQVRVPEALVLDIDATANPLHGKQEGRIFHAYYHCYCYLPLYVFTGQQCRRAGVLPEAQQDRWGQARGAVILLFAKSDPPGMASVRIIVRGDSAFCRQGTIELVRALRDVNYIIGLARNPTLEARVEYAQMALHEQYLRTLTKQRS